MHSLAAGWVRFDFVTMRFARSWCWRERWAAPLYATGAEFLFQEKAWEQGTNSSMNNAGMSAEA